MSTGLDSGLRINDNSILVECEENSKYQYKLVIYDNTFDDNPLEKVYAIGNIDYNKTDGNKIANFIIKLEENNYDSKKVFRQKRTQNIFKKSGYQLPSRLKNSGSNIIIRTIDDSVNKKSIILLKANNLSDGSVIGKIALQKQVKW